ncbi:MAG: ABC transporter substrate-binding protein [Chloroflexota bacterium]
MMSRRSEVLVATILIAAPLLLGCNFLSSLGDSDNPAARYGVQRDQALFLAGGQPLTLDPARTLSGPADVIGAIFSGLVTLDTNLQVQPDLAAGWQVSPDGSEYTFYLRPNAVFHDSRPITAQDVIFSWERATDPELGSDTAATYLGDIAGVREKLAGTAERISGLRLIDDHTLSIRLNGPDLTFLAKLTYPVAFVVDRQNVNQSDWEYQPNGTGPFRLVVWQDNEIIVLARNESYYLTPPAVSHLVYLIGAGLPLSLYETGQIDLTPIGSDTLARAQDPNSPLAAELHTAPTFCTTYVGLNTHLPPLDNSLVRQALNYALDKERLVEAIYGGNALVAAGPLPPGMPGYTGLDGGYSFDPNKARTLLAEAGYADPAALPPLTYTTAGYGQVDALVTAAVTIWQENLGIQIEVTLLDPYLYYDELYAGRVGHLFDGGWCADYPDPQNFLDVLYHSDSRQNLGGFSDPSIDRLLEQTRSELDVSRRLARYSQIEQMIVEQAPSVFVAHGVAAVLVKPYVQNYLLTPIGVAQWQNVSLER